jgi:hypothetical protein
MMFAAAVVFNPIGLDFIHSAFFSGEQLSRNIAQPFVFIAFAILAALIVLEWAARHLISRRRASGTPTASS